eukprot:2133928-Rhodomonas_salina.1
MSKFTLSSGYVSFSLQSVMVSFCTSITSSMCLSARAMAAPCGCHLLNTKAVTSRWRGTSGVFVSDDSRGKEG